MRRCLAILFVGLLLNAPRFSEAQTASTPPKTLAEVIALAPEALGPPPAGFETAFVIAAVTPIDGESCELQVATNGMLYRIYAFRSVGQCNHLPALGTVAWGRVRHSSVRSFVSEFNSGGPIDLLDLVYGAGKKPKTAKYFVQTAIAISPDWGQ